MLGGFPLKVEVEKVNWEDQNSGYNFLGNFITIPSVKLNMLIIETQTPSSILSTIFKSLANN